MGLKLEIDSAPPHLLCTLVMKAHKIYSMHWIPLLITYSCFDKGCPTKFKHTPQCRLTVIVYRYLIQAHEASARRKGKHEYTCLCCFLLSCWNTLQLQSGHSKPPVPITPFDIVAYAYTLLWDNLSQNSCTHLTMCIAVKTCLLNWEQTYGHHVRGKFCMVTVQKDL